MSPPEQSLIKFFLMLVGATANSSVQLPVGQTLPPVITWLHLNHRVGGVGAELVVCRELVPFCHGHDLLMMHGCTRASIARKRWDRQHGTS